MCCNTLWQLFFNTEWYLDMLLSQCISVVVVIDSVGCEWFPSSLMAGECVVVVVERVGRPVVVWDVVCLVRKTFSRMNSS